MSGGSLRSWSKSPIAGPFDDRCISHPPGCQCRPSRGGRPHLSGVKSAVLKPSTSDDRPSPVTRINLSDGAIVGPGEYGAKRYWVDHDFLTKSESEHFLSLVKMYRQSHKIPQIYRNRRGRSLDYSVIDGGQIRKHLVEIDRLYREINHVVNAASGKILTPLANAQVGVNVNITSPGGEYRWHYDRNELTGILYLNEVEGGETELYPGYRILLEGARYSKAQQVLDNLLELKGVRATLGKKVAIKPRQGTLLLMKGKTCLHSVRPVLGEHDRVAIIFSYDVPEASFDIEQRLDSYLYSENADSSSNDPNYK